MKSSFFFLVFILTFTFAHSSFGQTDQPAIVDVVWLKDGSKLSGTILKWELARGMEFKLLTGTVIDIPKQNIRRVMQDIPLGEGMSNQQEVYVRQPGVYAFKEKGWYQNTSGFLNFSDFGGAGIHHVMGYRFNRFVGVGLGTGIETNDFGAFRNIIPVYAEARGFLLHKKISPYYALKMGYGFALKDNRYFDQGNIVKAAGGFHFSPELGFRFGAGDVCYYLGLEYKIQNVSYVTQNVFGGGATFTDKISYRRLELRTGLLF